MSSLFVVPLEFCIAIGNADARCIHLCSMVLLTYINHLQQQLISAANTYLPFYRIACCIAVGNTMNPIVFHNYLLCNKNLVCMSICVVFVEHVTCSINCRYSKYSAMHCFFRMDTSCVPLLLVCCGLCAFAGRYIGYQPFI